MAAYTYFSITMATKDIINITVPVPVCLIDMLNNSGRFSIKELEKDFGVTIRGDMVPQISPGQGHTYYSIRGECQTSRRSQSHSGQLGDETALWGG